MLTVFSREYLNVLKKSITFNKYIGIKYFSNYNKNHNSTDRYFKNRDKFLTFSKEEVERLPFSTPYFEHLHGNYLDAPLDITTNSVSETPLLTRSNVGVGFLTLNSELLGAASVGSLCRELSDLEVNVYKRFDILTSVTRSVFSKGLDLFEISLFFESYSRLAELLNSKKNNNNSKIVSINASKDRSNSLEKLLHHNMKVIEKGLEDYVDNICDLLYIIKTYKKPLVVYGNGQMEGFGGNLCFMSNFSACYKHSTYQLNLDGRYFHNFGCTYVLSNLKGNLGEYLLFTNDKIVGEDLVLSILVKKYIDPESISNMQIVSDRLVELPEKHVERHIFDFTSSVSQEYRFLKFWNVMQYHFDHDNVTDIVDSLNKSYTNSDLFSKDIKKVSRLEVIEFEKSILDKFHNNPINTQKMQYLLNIIKKLKFVRYQILTELEINPKHWNYMINNMYKPTLNIKEENMKMLYNMIMEVLLVESLGMERELFYKYPYLDEIDKNEPNPSKWIVKGVGRDNSNPGYNISQNNIQTQDNTEDELSDSKPIGMITKDNYEYKIYERNPMSLSSLLSLKKLNINYNPKTKCEYDKAFLTELEKRYRPEHLKQTFKLMKNILNIEY